MKCPNCATENPDGAMFCMHCGKRMDGKIPCPHCGKLLPAEAEFCIYCGKRTKEPAQPQPAAPAAADPAAASGTAAAQTAAAAPAAESGTTPAAVSAPAVPAANGTAPVPPAMPQAAPPVYAAPAQAELAAAKPTLSPEERAAKRSGILQKITHYGAVGSSLAMALFALIFVFLIGVSLSTGTGGGIDLYYYFGGAYSDALSASGTAAAGRTVCAVFGTLISAVTMVCTAVFAIIGIVQGIFKLTKKKEYKRDYGLVSFLLYLGGAVAFLGFHAMSFSTLTSTYEIVSAGIVFNGGTAAGIALGTIAFACYLGCRVTAKWKVLFKENLLNTIFAFGMAVLTVVMFGLLSAPIYSFGDGGYSESYSIWAILFSMGIPNSSTGTVSLILFIVVQLLQIALVIFTAISLWKMLCSLQPEKGKPVLKWSIILTVFTGLFLIFSIAAGSVYSGSDSIPFGYAVPIVLFVFALLLLGAGITRTILKKRKEGPKQPKPVPAQRYNAQQTYGGQPPYAQQYGQTAAQNRPYGTQAYGYGAQQPYTPQQPYSPYATPSAYGAPQYGSSQYGVKPAAYGPAAGQPQAAQKPAPYSAPKPYDPQQPHAWQQQPAAKPAEPAQSAWQQQPAAKPAEPAQNAWQQQPAAKPAEPAQSAWQQQPAAKPAEPAQNAWQQQPAAKPAEPAQSAWQQQPAAKPAEPAQNTWQQQPAAKPAEPAPAATPAANEDAEPKEVRTARAIEEPDDEPIDW